MDAKDRLRRYLEQRRELGESELVLDSLSIDDVMKMVGAKSSASKGGSAPTTAKARAQTPVDRAAAAPSADALQAVPSAPVVPPPEPGVRFDEGATTDWREALRNAGAVRPSESLSPPAAAAPEFAAASGPETAAGAVQATDLRAANAMRSAGEATIVSA